MFSIPIHSPPYTGAINHPLVDETGAKCGVGQSGQVWFLGGPFNNSGIVVPLRLPATSSTALPGRCPGRCGAAAPVMAWRLNRKILLFADSFVGLFYRSINK